MELFYGILGEGTTQRADQGWRDGTTAIVLRAQPRAIAPAGLGKQVAVGPCWVVVRHDGACRLTLTPVIDGRVRDDLESSIDFEAGAIVRDEVVKWSMTQPLTWPGDAAPFSRQKLRGTFATVRAELEALEQATLNPAGAENALTFTAKALTGDAITIAYVDPGAPSQALSVGVVGNAITVNLATGAGGAIISTAAQIKTAIEGSAGANALVSVAIRDDDGSGSAHPLGDGSGVVTAMDAATLEAGDIYAVGGFELAARAVGVAGRRVPVS